MKNKFEKIGVGLCNTISVQYTLSFSVMNFLNFNSMKNSISSEKKNRNSDQKQSISFYY